MKTFLATYLNDGRYWSAEILAEDFDDAELRLKAMAAGQVDGELLYREYVWPVSWAVH